MWNWSRDSGNSGLSRVRLLLRSSFIWPRVRLFSKVSRKKRGLREYFCWARRKLPAKSLHHHYLYDVLAGPRIRAYLPFCLAFIFCHFVLSRSFFFLRDAHFFLQCVILSGVCVIRCGSRYVAPKRSKVNVLRGQIGDWAPIALNSPYTSRRSLASLSQSGSFSISLALFSRCGSRRKISSKAPVQ